MKLKSTSASAPKSVLNSISKKLINSKKFKLLLTFLLCINAVFAVKNWETVEVSFTAQNSYANAYTDVEFWVQLSGPDFNEKVHGFWDGGQTFKARMLGTKAGTWTYTTHSIPADPGLDGESGSFTTEDWTEAEKLENSNRRGIIRVTANGHALEYADGTPFFLVGDTHWSAFSFRYPYKGIEPAPDYVPSEGIGYEESVQHLKKLGFNSLGAILVYPSWANDGYPTTLTDTSGIGIRAAWGQVGGTAKDMHDKDGNRPFLFPGKAPGYPTVVPDFDRINPAFFKNIDKKFQYDQENGFYPYVETIRRDHGMYKNMINSFYSTPFKPVFNNEPYYLGSQRKWNIVDGENAGFDTPRDRYFARTQMWGNIFSGGIAGHMYGTVTWNSTIEENRPRKSDNVYIWEAPKLLKPNFFKC